MSFEGTTLRIVHFLDNPPADGVVLHANGWSGGDGCVSLECRQHTCGAQFRWPSSRENHWIPDRRHLNHCPGCGKTITGVEIPANPVTVPRPAVMG